MLLLLLLRCRTAIPCLCLLVIFASSGPAALAADPKMEDCEPMTCGNTLNVSYPFWIIDRHQPFCGVPTFGLTCNQSVPVLELFGEEYFVGDISYANKTMLLRESLDPRPRSHDFCSHPRRNLTFDPSQLSLSPFRIDARNRNLFIFINCTKVSVSRHSNMSCSDEGGRVSYVGDGPMKQKNYLLPDHAELYKACNSVVIAPYVPLPGADTTAAKLELLSRGFLLDWTVPECKNCSESGGRCGYDVSINTFMCICRDRPHKAQCAPSNSKKTKKALIGVGCSLGGFLLASALFLLWYRQKKNKERASSLNAPFRTQSFDNDPESLYGKCAAHIFSYDELEEATNGFSSNNELGDGGYGIVYKGKLRDGRVVAVKRLYDNKYNRLEQFLNEVAILNLLRHRNLVTLYGCTSRRSRELLLVYEFVPNGTVADHIHGLRAGARALTWSVRMNIAIETAEALVYLHNTDPLIIHRDVKTNNILLDENYHVKVADFGLSRFFPPDVSHVSTVPQGTPGYVDPEYHQCYQLTEKSDVYSFGVVLVELISSKPAVDVTRHKSEVNLSNMAISKIQKRLLHELVDLELGYDADQKVRGMIESVAELAFRCLQAEKDMRPSMEEVLEVLKGIANRDKIVDDSLDVEKKLREDASLLNDPIQYSPDTVHTAWLSTNTTPNPSS